MAVAPARRLDPSPTGLDDRERAIAQSVLYAGLFDYPLTLAQLRTTLIACRLTPSEVLGVYRRSERLRALIDSEDGWFFPAGRREFIDERRRRERRSRAFLQRHRLYLGVLRRMPWVRLAALSGSVAHLNLEGAGDLDLFLVTRRHRVWVVTVAAIVLAKLLRRRATACVNYVIDETVLGFEPPDLFSASQIIHLKPLTGWPVYEQLLAANPFVGAHYPNFHPTHSRALLRRESRVRLVRRGLELLLAPLGGLAEIVCRRAYRGYLLRRASTWRSPEQVRLTDSCVKLHTHSHRRRVMMAFTDQTQNLEFRT
jgi:hypothetical protein